MLERFHLEEVSQIDVDQAYAVYFTTSSPFTLEDADLFERLTGGKTGDVSELPGSRNEKIRRS